MPDFTSLIAAIGDFFTKADWYAMVKWPFWILLTTVAAGGVYTARFGKKNLICQGVSGLLNLIILYLVFSLGYTAVPALRTMLSEMPFLSVTETAVTAVDPWGLSWAAIPPVMLRLMILVFLLIMTDNLGLNPKTLLTWLAFQILDTVIALVLYAIITAGVSLIFPSLLGRFALIPVVLVLLIGLVVLCAKFVFTVIIREPNTYFPAVYKFFTVNRFGSMLTVSAVSFLLAVLTLTLLNLLDCSVLTFASANRTGLVIILVLCMVVQYFFSMFYSDRKKG